MDHFARPEDELAVAAHNHRLHRNFQGYCTSARACQVYALGASAISPLDDGYIHNAKDLDRYLAAVNAGKLSHEYPYRMRPQDKAVRYIINGLLCAGETRVSACLDAEAWRSIGSGSTWTIPWRGWRLCWKTAWPLSPETP